MPKDSHAQDQQPQDLQCDFQDLKDFWDFEGFGVFRILDGKSL